MALSLLYLQQRRTRLIFIAILITIAITYFSFERELQWQERPVAVHDGNVSPLDVAGVSDIYQPPNEKEKESADDSGTPSGEKLPSTSPAAASDGSSSSSDDSNSDADYDYERPTSASEAGYPVPQNGGSVLPSPSPSIECMSFEQYQYKRPEPFSKGFRQFPFVRPPLECRTFTVPAVENYIKRMEKVIKDPDLYRLFENSYPNTLDTMIKWHGFANRTVNETSGESVVTDEELTYVITGDIDAMWLRDSASQVYSYLSFLEPSTESDSLASLWRGLINAHSRYIIISPYCHSFQPPPESGIPPTHNGAYSQNNPNPPYNPALVFDCKWELDSLASFLQVSVGYYVKTGDLKFFSKYNWVEAVQAAVEAAGAMRLGTYDKDGKVLPSAWTFTGWTNRGSETLTNDGLGNPVQENGMVRTAFRPSDDATIFQLLTPANMMWAKYLEEASLIMEQLDDDRAANLTKAMRSFAFGIREGIDRDAVVHHRDFGDIFAYECDGFGGVNLMDDSNVPSLLAMPLFNYSESSFPLPENVTKRDYARIYQNTRHFVQSAANPYFARGPVISAVGGPHLGPGKAWPMAAIVAGMTALEEDYTFLSDEQAREEVAEQLLMVLNSTSGTGVVHESVNSWNDRDFSRSWFGWANGLFGELILKIEQHDKIGGSGTGGLLDRSWQ